MRENREVAKEEFDKFLIQYPNKLKRDVNQIFCPPVVSYNDFSIGDWPDSVVAFIQTPYDPEKDKAKYFIKELTQAP